MSDPRVHAQRLSGGIEELEFDPALLDDARWTAEIGDALRARRAFIIRNVIPPGILAKIVDYLKTVGRHSLPTYEPLLEGCRDFHRLSRADPRNYVISVAHQFAFHSWNQNVFDLFAIVRPVFVMRNLFSGFAAEQFLANTPRDPYVARIAFLHYPRGGGMMAAHADPVGEHQLTVPVLQLSEPGTEYAAGGAFVIGPDGETVDVEARMHAGDVFFMNGEVTHGVAPVDPGVPLDWLSFQGRWVMLAAVIKTLANDAAPNAVQVRS